MSSCTLTGDWDRFGMVLKSLTAKVFPVAKAELDAQGDLILKKLKDHIDAQDLNWEGLSPLTIQRKGNSQVYVETGELKDRGFTAIKLNESSSSYSLYVGPNPNMIHTQSGLPMNDLVLYLEFGTSRMPPRPLIRPTFEEVQSSINTKLKDDIIKLLKG